MESELKPWKFGYYSTYMTPEGINYVLYDCRTGLVEERLFDSDMNEKEDLFIQQNKIIK